MNYFRYSDNIIEPDLSDLKSKVQGKSIFIRRDRFLLMPLQTYVELTTAGINDLAVTSNSMYDGTTPLINCFKYYGMNKHFLSNTDKYCFAFSIAVPSEYKKSIDMFMRGTSRMIVARTLCSTDSSIELFRSLRNILRGAVTRIATTYNINETMVLSFTSLAEVYADDEHQLIEYTFLTKFNIMDYMRNNRIVDDKSIVVSDNEFSHYCDAQSFADNVKKELKENSILKNVNKFEFKPNGSGIDSYVEVFCPSGSWSNAQFRGCFTMLFNLAGHVESKAADIIIIKLKDNFALNCGIV